MNKSFWLLLVCSLLFSACKKELNLFKSRDKKFAVENIEFEYLSSRAKFKYSDGAQKISATASFRIQKDSIIWASISPGLGVELARLKIDREKLQGIDKLKKEYYVYTFEELSKQYGFQITFDLIEAIVIGNPLYLPENRKEVIAEEELFKYAKLEGQYGIDHYVGKQSKKLEKLFAYDATTYNSVSVNYGDFQPVDGQIIPQSINAIVSFANQRRKEPLSIEIEYNRTEIQSEPLSFPFSVSKRYKRK